VVYNSILSALRLVNERKYRVKATKMEKLQAQIKSDKRKHTRLLKRKINKAKKQNKLTKVQKSSKVKKYSGKIRRDQSDSLVDLKSSDSGGKSQITHLKHSN
jgi:hypothetical protein